MLRIKAYKMAIAPFLIIPEHAIFRYKKEWWRRKAGSKYVVEKYIEDSIFDTSGIYSDTLESETLVAVANNQITQESDRLLIVEQFDICPIRKTIQ